MADRLVTPLGTKGTELLVAQDGIRSIGKFVDMLLLEFDQQAFEAYLSSDFDRSAVGCTRQTLKTGSFLLSHVHAANHNSAKRSPEANKSPCRVFPQAVGGSPPTVKRNRNIERCQHHHEQCL